MIHYVTGVSTISLGVRRVINHDARTSSVFDGMACSQNTQTKASIKQNLNIKGSSRRCRPTTDNYRYGIAYNTSLCTELRASNDLFMDNGDIWALKQLSTFFIDSIPFRCLVTCGSTMSPGSGSHATMDDVQDLKQAVEASETSAKLPEITEAQAKPIFGLREDTSLHGQNYSWLGSIFYFGYLAMEIPSVWLMAKVSVGKYIGVCLVLWEITLCLMSVCHNFAGLATVRFFLGVFEAAVLPCMMLLNPMWYRKEEQPLRTAFWYNTFAGVFGGILSYAIGGIDGSLATWKALETFRDPACYCIWICAFRYAIENAGVTKFNPLIISGYGFRKTKTVLMATPQAAVAMVTGATFTAVSYKVPNVRCILWIFSAIVGMIGAVMVHILDVETNRNASLAGVYLMGFYNVPRVFMLIAIIYAVGNIIGPQFFLQRQAPHYFLGIGAMLTAFAVMAASGLAYHVYCFYENKRRDRIYGDSVIPADVQIDLEVLDQTDREDLKFKYIY
ncbi:hypothetical protein Q7P35_008719 [Cladosporium inversicolor]